MGRGSKQDVYLKRLGLKLRKIREDRRWTLEETEEDGWPNWRHLQRVEAGKNITLATLIRIADLYETTPAELLKGL